MCGVRVHPPELGGDEPKFYSVTTLTSGRNLIVCACKLIVSHFALKMSVAASPPATFPTSPTCLHV